MSLPFICIQNQGLEKQNQFYYTHKIVKHIAGDRSQVNETKLLLMRLNDVKIAKSSK